MKLSDTIEILGFAHWASALFNGDASGLEDEDVQLMERWLDQEVGSAAHHSPIDYREEGFRWNVFNGLGGDAATYVFPVYLED
jgi:hypothetical protein